MPRFLASFAPLCAFFFLYARLPCEAVSFDTSLGPNELYAEFEDPYYFSAGLYCSLSKNPIPTLDTISELVVYRHLRKNLLKPNCFLVEIGVYPLPLAGVAAKAWAPAQYRRARIGDVNVIRTITESMDFKEPWSLSFFFGHMVFFKKDNVKVNGHGNIGLLCTYGNYHIKDNLLYPDNWGEFELKVKLDKSGNDRQYATSYRVGSRIHDNKEIKDFFYLGLTRDRTDFIEPCFSLIRNANLQLRGDCSFQPLKVLSLSVEAGKKRPFRWKKTTYAFGLSLGVTWNVNNAYSGKLGEGFKPNGIVPIIRPMLKF
jgi:hypothetical protein